MRRFILTGAPGSGKTAILRQLEIEGYSVVEEAATDVITAAHNAGSDQPWQNASFIDAVVKLQRDRQTRASCQRVDIQFHDRSAVCTAALAAYLGHAISPVLRTELERIVHERIYEPRALFVRNLGFVVPTAARRISFEETLHFERMHEETYRKFGFELIEIAPGSLIDRCAWIKAAIA